MDYVTGDIHGCFDKFLRLLKKIKFSDNDNLYVIGDVIDRGESPIEVLQYIMEQPNIHMLLGNHEDMMLEYMKNPDSFNERVWYQNGGYITHSQYLDLPENKQKEIINFIKNLPYYFIVNDKILVHAGVDAIKIDNSKDILENLKRQTKDDLVWIRDEFIFSPTRLKDYKIIFGHTPTRYINGKFPMSIWHDTYYNDKIGIDCGAVFNGGRLSCIRLDDMKEFYI